MCVFKDFQLLRLVSVLFTSKDLLQFRLLCTYKYDGKFGRNHHIIAVNQGTISVASPAILVDSRDAINLCRKRALYLAVLGWISTWIQPHLIGNAKITPQKKITTKRYLQDKRRRYKTDAVTFAREVPF